MVESSIQFLFNLMTNLYLFLDNFILFGQVSFLDFIVTMFIVTLIVVNFIPRG